MTTDPAIATGITTGQILLIAAALLVLLGLILFLRMGMRRLKARTQAEIAAREAAPAAPALAAAPPPPPPPPPGDDSPFLAAPEGEADDLSRIKGLGPKLSARLAELGVFHYRQIAGWTPEQLAIVDAQLGNFQGRPERDRWQEQARLLAAGDLKAYERAHGKLGGTSGSNAG